jgi:hypothetical protein
MSDRREINVCPQYYQDILTRIGGVNRYDSPNFKLVWSQYETYVAGGIWSVDEQYFKGYRRLLLGSGEPCWTLLQWHDAIEYGTPESYYVQNYDADSSLQILGEYPYSGRYEVVFNLRYHQMEDNKLTFHTMPLNNTLIDKILPIMLMARGISWMKTKAAAMELQRQEEEEKTRMIERHLQDNAPAFGRSAVSFTRQGVRSTEIDKRMIEMQRMWNTLAKAAAEMPKGMSTR